jgi:hypothetical protein
LAGLSALLRRRSPFVTQQELLQLLGRDRADLLVLVRMDDDIMSRRFRVTRPAPQSVRSAWKGYLAWLEVVVEQLQQPRSAAELEEVIKEWRTERSRVFINKWGWSRRSDVLAVDRGQHAPEVP